MFFQRFLFRKYLNRDETLLYVVHQHWITVKDQMIRIGLFGYGLPLAFLIFFTGISNPLSYFFVTWILIAFCYSLYAFLDWYLDAWLLTDISIIDTSWDGFFKQRASRIEYSMIESVNIETSGISQAILNYGHIHVIRSSGANLKMEYVSNPQQASAWLSRITSEVKSTRNAQNSEAIKNLLADIIEEHIKVNL